VRIKRRALRYSESIGEHLTTESAEKTQRALRVKEDTEMLFEHLGTFIQLGHWVLLTTESAENTQRAQSEN
jgi:hypothetical protein